MQHWICPECGRNLYSDDSLGPRCWGPHKELVWMEPVDE